MDEVGFVVVSPYGGFVVFDSEGVTLSRDWKWLR